MSPMTRRFVAQLEDFVAERGIPMVQFCKGQRNDAVMAEHLRRFAHEEGIVFVGKAQENTPVFRTERHRNPKTGQPYPWIVRQRDGEQLLRLCRRSGFLGHSFSSSAATFHSMPNSASTATNTPSVSSPRKQLYEALDNGILSCADPKRLQAICDGLSAAKIDALLRKWLRLLPHPFTGADRKAGYRYDISILQAEFSTTPRLWPAFCRPRCSSAAPSSHPVPATPARLPGR